MPRTRLRMSATELIGASALVFGCLMTAGVPVASAHQEPPGCSATGVGLALEAFRADRVTPISLVETVSECETMCVRATVMAAEDPAACAFQGGTLTITTPRNVIAGITLEATLTSRDHITDSYASCSTTRTDNSSDWSTLDTSWRSVRQSPSTTAPMVSQM